MESLFYILERIFHVTAIPVHAYDSTGKVALFNKGCKAGYDPLDESDFKEELFARAKQIERPFLKTEDNICVYGIIKDPTDCVIIMGPYSLGRISEREMKAYTRKHNVPYEKFNMARGSMLELTSAMALFYYSRTGEMLLELDIKIDSENEATDITISENDISNYMMRNVEEEIKHIDYQTEFLYLKQIREGDIDSVKKDLDPNFDLDSVGRIASASLKRFEYMICTSIALATRAAIEGGLDPETAYAISDLYMQRLEMCKSVNDYFSVQRDMKYAYAKQVRNARDTRSKISYVEKCKVFIANHLNKPFDLEDLASELGLAKAHLSRKFKKEMGMGIMQYTRLKRVETAANMLKFSNESISVIANYLCFPSQSHFGAVFKSIKGVSPQKYRDSEQVI